MKLFRDKFFLLILAIIFLVGILLYQDILNVNYSYIGDEYPFFDYAKEILTNPQFKPSIFSQSGVYGYHPVLDSYIHAFFMSIFGINLVGWKITNIVAISLSSLLIYFLSNNLF